MKKTTILLALVLVLGALSFSGRAAAQGSTGRVWLTYDSSNGYFNHVGFIVTLQSNDTGDYYHLESWLPQYDEPNTYRLGSVPAGSYRLSVHLRTSRSIPDGWNFDWWSADQSGTNVYITNWTETLLTDDIEVEADSWNDPGLHIHLTDN